jgi:signal transduction histidine kinase/CheY-like chemotaxis protein
MRSSLSLRVFSVVAAAVVLPLLVAAAWLLPALRTEADRLNLGSTRLLAEAAAPACRELVDGLRDHVAATMADPVLVDPAAEDAARQAVLDRVVAGHPALAGVSLHRPSDVALTTLEGRIPHPDGATWARLGRGGVEVSVRRAGDDVRISLLAAASSTPSGDAAEILEFALAPEALNAPLRLLEAADAALVDGRGQVVAHRNPSWPGRRFGNPGEPGAVVTRRLAEDDAAAAGGWDWSVQVRVPPAPADGLRGIAGRSLFGAGLLGAALGAPLAWLLARWIRRPLERTAEAVARMERRDFQGRLKEEGPRALGRLHRALNALAQKLEAHLSEVTVQRDRLAARVQQEEAMAALLARRLEAVARGSRDGFLCVSDPAGEGNRPHTWWNERFAQFGRFAGQDLETLDAAQVARRLAWQFSDSERFLEWWNRVSAQPGEETSQVWALRQPEDGMARVSRYPWRDGKGQVTGSVWRFEDRTEEARLQRKAEDVERAELIGNLTAGIGQEFNRILTGVVGDMTALDQDLPPAERHRLLGHARTVAHRAGAICRALLGYSRSHLLEPRIIGVAALLTWVREEIAERLGPGFLLEVQLPDHALHVTADRNRIRSVLLELCANAVRSMPHGGSLRITAEPLDLEPGTRVASEAGRYVCLTVEDTGNGIPEDIRDRIFEPFFTTDPRASGLGLAVVSGIVWQHGGWITCDSATGRGTSIRVYLPASELPVTMVVEDGSDPLEARVVSEAAVPPGTAPAPVSEGPLVLVVDDEEPVRRLTQAILRRGGFASLGASGGEEALEQFRRHRDRIALVVLDLNMPGMSGTELFRILRAEGSFVPVIVVSGYLLDFNAFEMDSGARPTGFLQKPYQADQLLQLAGSILERPALRPAA